MAAEWDDIEYVDETGVAHIVQRVTIESDRHPGNEVFAVACNAATRTILHHLPEDDDR